MQVQDGYHIFKIMSSTSGKPVTAACTAIGKTRQWWHKRATTGRGKFSLDEWRDLADQFGYSFRVEFTGRRSGEKLIWYGDE